MGSLEKFCSSQNISGATTVTMTETRNLQIKPQYSLFIWEDLIYDDKEIVSFLPVHLKAFFFFFFFFFFFTMKCFTDRRAFSDWHCWCFKPSSSGSDSSHHNTCFFPSFHCLRSSADSKPNDRPRCSRRVSTILCVHPRRCQPANCSGHGDCVDGRCRCQDGWQGAACDSLVCRPPACGPHGFCTAGKCGGGAQLQQVVENQNTSVSILWCFCTASCVVTCLLCDAGGCVCDAGWRGKNCSQGD